MSHGLLILGLIQRTSASFFSSVETNVPSNRQVEKQWQMSLDIWKYLWEAGKRILGPINGTVMQNDEGTSCIWVQLRGWKLFINFEV